MRSNIFPSQAGPKKLALVFKSLEGKFKRQALQDSHGFTQLLRELGPKTQPPSAPSRGVDHIRPLPRSIIIRPLLSLGTVNSKSRWHAVNLNPAWPSCSRTQPIGMEPGLNQVHCVYGSTALLVRFARKGARRILVAVDNGRRAISPPVVAGFRLRAPSGLRGATALIAGPLRPYRPACFV